MGVLVCVCMYYVSFKCVFHSGVWDESFKRKIDYVYLCGVECTIVSFKMFNVLLWLECVMGDRVSENLRGTSNWSGFVCTG